MAFCVLAAIRTLTDSCQDTEDSSNASGSQQPDQAVDLQFSSMQGLRQGLAAALSGKSSCSAGASGGMCGDDVEIVVSGQVRLQCSPVRQRPQQATAASRGDAQDGPVARALAVAASRSTDRCRAAGRSKGAAAAMQQAADAKAAAAAAAAFAAQAKPLKAALQEVHGMIAAMENMCHVNSSSSSNGEGPAQVLTYKSSPVAAAAAKGARGSAAAASCWQRQSSPVPRSHHLLPQQQQQQQRMRSPDCYRLRGQLKHVQEQLVKLEVKMNQAAAMQEDPCFCNSAADSMAARCSSPTRGSPGGSVCAGPGSVLLHSPGCKGGSSGAGCKGGCVRRVAGKRQVLVGRMQDEIGQLQQELAELRELMPGAYA
jgi:hypothetical protein